MEVIGCLSHWNMLFPPGTLPLAVLPFVGVIESLKDNLAMIFAMFCNLAIIVASLRNGVKEKTRSRVPVGLHRAKARHLVDGLDLDPLAAVPDSGLDLQRILRLICQCIAKKNGPRSTSMDS